MNLSNARVIGFFSLPSPALAEQNPAAYNAAMAGAPAGAGSCAHCGTGIVHHVVVATAAGATAFIGTSCAEKVGEERVKTCVRARLTDEQLMERERKAQAAAALRQAEEDANTARLAARAERLKDVLDVLRAQETDFHSSLAAQLGYGSLTWRQAECVAKAVVGRCTKKTEAAWNAIYERCMED
jgi:DNA-binding protein H-NS